MKTGILTLAFFVIVGVIAANIIANPSGTKVVLDSIGSIWSTSINGLRAGNAAPVK